MCHIGLIYQDEIRRDHRRRIDTGWARETVPRQGNNLLLEVVGFGITPGAEQVYDDGVRLSAERRRLLPSRKIRIIAFEVPMEAFSSLDLQQRTGDVQQAAARAPVLLTSHSRPRNVMMSVAEYRRLKAAVGEPVPPEVQESGGTVRGRVDPLGYDISDWGAAIDRMIADVKSGRTRVAVAAELAAVRRAYNAGGR